MSRAPRREGELWRLVAVTVLALAAASCRVNDAPADAPDPGPAIEFGRFESGDCPFAVTPGAIGRGTLDCGSILVPDRHDADRGGVYRLPVAVLRRPPTGSTTPPIVFLHGGPGGRLFAPSDGSAPLPVAGAASIVFSALAAAAPRSDIVLFEPRGVSTSTTSPACAIGSSEGADRDASVLHAQWVRCVQAWDDEADNSVATMRTSEYAKDVEMLREALGVERWTLYGSSHGTRVVLELLARTPWRVHAAVLDSPVTLDRPLERINLDALVAALERAFSDCESDRHCRAAWPNFRENVLDAPAVLDRDPVPLAFGSAPVSPEQAMYGGTDFLEQVHALLYSGTWASSLPRLADAAVRRDTSFLRRAIGAEDPDSPLPASYGVDLAQRVEQFEGALSLPVNIAYRCNEYAYPAARPSGDREPVSARRLRALVEARLFPGTNVRPVCEALGIVAEPPDASASERILVDAPVLVLAGGMDPQTSASEARTVARRIGGSRLRVLQAGGHTPGMTSDCGARMVHAFLRSADASVTFRTGDSPTCARETRAVVFATDEPAGYRDTDNVYSGATLRVPLGWGELLPGSVFARYVTNDLSLAQLLELGSEEDVVETLERALPIEDAVDAEVPPAERRAGTARVVGERVANGVTWTLRELERASGVTNRFATAGFGRRVGLVMVSEAPGVVGGDVAKDVLHAAIDGFSAN